MQTKIFETASLQVFSTRKNSQIMAEKLDIVNQILMGLQRTCKEIPYHLLYNKEGSELYEEITKLKAYYPYAAEEAILEQHAGRIAAQLTPKSVLVELGCGTARKTVHLLNAVQSRYGSCRFIGIDVSKSALEKASVYLENEVKYPKGLEMKFIQAEYMQGLKEVRRLCPENVLCIMWLGSSIGNLSQTEAILFLKDVTSAVGHRCQLFLCTDMWKDYKRLYAAYKDDKGLTERFIKNGIRNALHILGQYPSLDEEKDWIYQVEINNHLRQVEMYVCFPSGLQNGEMQVNIRPGERVLVEISRKFTVEDIYHLAHEAGFHVHAAWRNATYGCQMLLPAQEAFLRCWKDTDSIFFLTIPDWTVKPISLRHCYSFYYAHVVAFSKLKLLPEDSTSDQDMMFSRGIDPIVIEPSKCHSHPQIPSEWPDRATIVAYVKQARAKILKAVKSGKLNMKLESLVLEHERLHQETLEYMITQEKRLSFESNPACASSFKQSAPVHDTCTTALLVRKPDVLVPAGEVCLGANANSTMFLWDNEYPSVHKTVEKPFWISSTPVSIREYMNFVSEKCYDVAAFWDPADYKFFQEKGLRCPGNWSLVGGEYYVHYTHASKHWSEVGNDPVYVSLSEALAFCKWQGCRIMTEAEYQRVLDCSNEAVKHLRDGGWEWTSSIFHPFPGFQPMAEYPEYSTDFFDGSHYVLKGSSPATHPSLLRDSFRNFYQRQYPYVFAKFRCCQ